MSEVQREQMKRELWFNLFTEVLYKRNIITKEQKAELEKSF